MITSLTLNNFRAFRHATVTLSPLTVIVGPNASGKSSILEALRIGSDAATNARLPSADASRRLRNAPGDQKCSITIDAASGGRVHVRPDDGAIPRERDGGGFGVPLLIRFETDKLQQAIVLSRPDYALQTDGTNLVAVLHDLLVSDRAGFDAVETEIKRIVPSIKALSLRRSGPDMQLFFEPAVGGALPSASMSSGSLVVLGILVALRMRDAATLLLIDEIDRGLHPGAVGGVVDALREAMVRRPDLQIVATTHSPYVLDAVDASEVRVTSLLPDGTATIAALTDHPRWDEYKHVARAGELWGILGEDWVTARANGG